MRAKSIGFGFAVGPDLLVVVAVYTEGGAGGAIAFSRFYA